MNDRIFGYSIIIALIVFLIAPVSFLIWKSVKPVDSYIIEFSPIKSIAFLDIQDPVYSRGVEIGQVRQVNTRDHISYALIEIRKDIKIFSDYKASIIPKGVMGDRYLEINSGMTLPKMSPKDTLNGSFVMGPAEAISYIDLLRIKVGELSQLTEKLKTGTEGKKSLIAGLWDGVETFDSISKSISELTMTLNKEIEDKASTLEEILKKSSLITVKASRLTPIYMNNIEKLLTQTNAVMIQVNSIVEKSSKVTNQLQKADVIIWSDKLKNLQSELKNTIQFINNLEMDGIKLPVKLTKKKNKP